MQQDEKKSPVQVSFLTSEEKDFIARLRSEFKDELNKRLAEGRHHECFFGDIALCRICHSCSGNLDVGKFWLWRWIQMAQTFQLDELYEEVYEQWRGYKPSESQVSDPVILPFYEEVRQYVRIVYCAPKLSPEGDMIAYMPLSDQDKHGVLAGLDWDHFVKYQRAQIVLRCLDLERLSRSQNRLAKVIWICDMNGCTMDSISLSSFDRMQARDVNNFAETIACEVVNKFYIVNAPWAVTALHGLVKAFMPEKFTRKLSFASGDGLGDTELVEKAGGEEQLKSLYAMRAGLVSKPIHSVKVYTEMLDTFADKDEQEIINMLRSRFKDEFAKRKAEGRDYEPFFGDRALLRVVRGNNGCLGSAVNWFKRFLKRVEEHKLDSLIEDMTRRLDESGGVFGATSMLPYYDEIQEHSRLIFTAPRLSPKGDLISYLPLGDHNRAGIIANVPWEHWARHVLGNVVLRSIECDRLSRTQNRLVRFIQIADMDGSGMGVSGLPSVPTFDLRQKLELEPLMMEVSVDVMRATYVMNAPWLAVKAYNMFKMLVPERMSAKMNLVDGDGRSDPELVRLLGGEAQLQQFFAFKVGLVAGIKCRPSSGIQEIAAGGEFQTTREVRPGQRVVWSFLVESGSADDWLGASDVAFSVTAFWFPQLALAKDGEPEAQKKAARQEEGSLEFDGEGGYVQITEVPTFNAFTWSLWVKPTPDCWWNEHCILRRADQVCLNVIDGSLRLWLHDGHWHCVVKVGWDIGFADAWHHLAASFDGEMARLFVNGTLVASARAEMKLSETINRVLVGAGLNYADRYFFKGKLTEVRLHSVALSSEQISASMRTRIDPRSESSLFGYAQLCGGVSFAQRQGVLLENNIGKVAARSYNGGATFATTESPFSWAHQAADPSGKGTQDPTAKAAPQLESSPAPQEVIVPVTVVTPNKLIVGKYTAQRTGVIAMKWSNSHSRMRSKSLRYSLEGEDLEEGGDHVFQQGAPLSPLVEGLEEEESPVSVRHVGDPALDVPPPVKEKPSDILQEEESSVSVWHVGDPEFDVPPPVTEKPSDILQATAKPEVRAAAAVVALAKYFEEQQGPDAVYMLDE